MPRFKILCIGRNAKDPLLQSAQTYLQRLEKFTNIKLIRLREGTTDFEEKQLETKLNLSDYLIALDEHGKDFTTRQLAQNLEKWDMNGINTITFIIGGSDGLAPSIKQRAHQLWSLSKLTLPHRLAQVLLLEQLYRAIAINRGLPYHRD